MSNEIFVPFNETIFRLPSCLNVHKQFRSNLNKFTLEDYLQFIRELNVCGIIRKTESETVVLGLAVYHTYLTTFDTIRFEIDDIVVDEKERNHGLGTRLLQYVIEQAKQSNVKQILIHCDPTNTDAHRWLFRFGLTVLIFGFYLTNFQSVESNNEIRVIDITDLPEEENEELLKQAHEIYLQLRPHLPIDQKAYITQIRDICRTGPARLILAINNNEILGLSLYRVSRNVEYSKYIYCDDLVTNENKRGSGVGRCLINYMKSEAEKLGIDRLTLDSGCQRGRAHKFYHREGFIINQFGFSMVI